MCRKGTSGPGGLTRYALHSVPQLLIDVGRHRHQHLHPTATTLVRCLACANAQAHQPLPTIILKTAAVTESSEKLSLNILKKNGSFRFDSIRFDSIRFDSIRFHIMKFNVIATLICVNHL